MSEENWIPEPLREAPFFKAAEGESRTPDQVLADLTNAAQHMGNSIRIPGESEGDDAIAAMRSKILERVPGLMPVPSGEDPDQLKDIFTSLGRPHEASAYELPEVEGVDWSQHDMSELKGKAHAMNMTKDQFKAMVSDQFGSQVTGQREASEALAADLESLKQEWGGAFEQRTQKIAGLLNNSEAPDYLRNALAEGKLPAADLKWLHAVADSMGSEGAEITNQDAGAAVLTPNQALDELSGIENRADRAMWEPSHPDYKRLNQRRVELIRLANPG